MLLASDSGLFSEPFAVERVVRRCAAASAAVLLRELTIRGVRQSLLGKAQ